MKQNKKVRDKLGEMGKSPRIETIRSRIKDFYDENYSEWLKNVKNEIEKFYIKKRPQREFLRFSS